MHHMTAATTTFTNGYQAAITATIWAAGALTWLTWLTLWILAATYLTRYTTQTTRRHLTTRRLHRHHHRTGRP